MSNKITPQQAFDAIKTLWPEVANLSRNDRGNETDSYAYLKSELGACLRSFKIEIDWPEGVTQWPPPEHTWRNARMPEDWGKPARFRDSLTWRCDRTIAGYAPGITGPWIDSKGQTWWQCQVVDDSPVEVAKPIITKAEGDKAGDGWRILGSKEVIEAGDEFKQVMEDGSHNWCKASLFGATAGERLPNIYRRKVDA